MNILQLESICRRAAQHSLSQTKLIITASVLSLCGLLVVFCMGLAIAANTWFTLSLSFLPIFISGSVLIGLGVVLMRAYHDEIKNKEVNYSQLATKSWETIVSASYMFMPIILIYLLQWMLLGLFILLKEIPIVGLLFGVILAFAPFLLNLGSLVLCAVCVLMLFSFTPVIALKNVHSYNVLQLALSQAQKRPCIRLFLLAVAIVPVVVASFILWLAAYLTTASYMIAESHLQIVLQWFFIMIPFAALLAPAVIFFFNMAAEAHVLIQKSEAKEVS